MSDNLLVGLYMATMFFGLISLVCGGLLIWFRKAVFNTLKLKKLIKFGFKICRLKRNDRTEKEIVTIPNKELKGVRFPGVKGIYLIDDASVILKEGKFPVYEWVEEETLPINYQKETIDTEISCPKCAHTFEAAVKRIKAPSPTVLDNLILFIKTLNQMFTTEKLLLFLGIGAAVLLIGLAVNGFLIYDFKERIGEILAPTIADACKSKIVSGAANTSIIIK